MKSPYISRVSIKNFRNFKNSDVYLDHKQVIVGENSVGKTNYIFALQLILDPSLSDYQRMLNESDFYEHVKDPFKNKEEISIVIEIDNYEHNKNILAQLGDCIVKDKDGKEKIRLTYKFKPILDKANKYEYIIYKGNKVDHLFTYKDREILNMKVIPALRDVELDLKSSSKSPINKMIKDYEIEIDNLQDIVKEMHKKSEEFLDVDEIIDISQKINKTYNSIIGLADKDDSKLKLNTTEVDPNRILQSLKLINDNRSLNDSSLGINNIIYISLILSYLKDDTIPTLIKEEKMNSLLEKDDKGMLLNSYQKTKYNNFKLKEDLSNENLDKLYEFMANFNDSQGSVTILAIEEPEAHLHPINQRLIYQNVINNNSSVILTTHSAHITSIAPINYMVSLRKYQNEYTDINSAYLLDINHGEKLDIERYIDIKKSEIYFGKGVIFVEGIAEEYLIPKFAELLGYNLDQYGIVVCNINSTNFKPFISLSLKLKIPFAVITDGDFYYINEDKKEQEDEKEEEDKKREYHILKDVNDERQYGYLGYDILCKQMKSIDLLAQDFNGDKSKLKEKGIFINDYTLEVEIMSSSSSDEDSQKVLCDIFSRLTAGGPKKQLNFKKELQEGKYFKCLKKIEETGLGKGRYSQVLSNELIKSHIPTYISEAIDYIVKEVRDI